MTGLQSMTGFASLDGDADWGRWSWSAKSVNGRGLDLRIALPAGFEALDGRLRKYAGSIYSRGNFQIGLRLETHAGLGGPGVDLQVLETVIAAFAQVSGAPPDGAALATLMTLKGVVESPSSSARDLAESSDVLDQLAKAGETCLQALAQTRRGEGTALRGLLLDQLDQMESLQQTARHYAGEQVAQISERYRTRLAELDQEGVVPPDRIAVEIATLATKADVLEELDRLSAHIERGRTLLDAAEPVGRTLGFLAQELNREANTLCSKSVSLNLTETGLALKGVVDQFKEQAANVE